MTIYQHIARLEKGQRNPGTSLRRCFLEGGQIGWVLGIGEIADAKEVFYGKTIQDVLTQAEEKHGRVGNNH